MARRRKARGQRIEASTWEDFSQDLGLVSPQELRAAILKAGTFVFDLETTGLNPRRDRIEGIAFYVPPLNGAPTIRAWFPFRDFTFMCNMKVGEVMKLEPMLAPIGVDFAAIREQISGRKPDDLVLVNLRPPMDQEETMEGLRPIFGEQDIIDIAAHRKFDDSFLYFASGTSDPIIVNNIKGDSMLVDFCSDERRKRYGLKWRVRQEFGHTMTTYNEATRGHSLLPFCNSKPLGVYAMDDCYWTYRLHERKLADLRKQTPAPKGRKELRWTVEKQLGRVMGKLEKIYWGIDTKVSDVLMEMETSGVLIDWRWLREVEERLLAEKDEIAVRIEKFLGWPLNPNSGREVADALFAPPPDGLGLPLAGIPIGQTGDPSTADKIIKHFARFHPLVSDILKSRSLDTVLSGFVTKLIKLATESEDGRVYSGFNQTRTVIARLSSSKPINFQNQPRDRNLVRKAYVAYREGIDPDDTLLFGADYGQIELRVAAHLAVEDNMIEVYQMGGICTANDGDACDRYKVWACEEGTCEHKWMPKDWTATVNPCPKCGSGHTEHQRRCRHVDLHQRTAEDAKVKRNPLAKCLDGSTLLLPNAQWPRTRTSWPRTIESVLGHIKSGEHRELGLGVDYGDRVFSDGRGGKVRAKSGLKRHNRPTKIVVTKRAIVVATDDHRFQVIGNYDSLDPNTPGYVHEEGFSLVEAQNLEKGMKVPLADCAGAHSDDPKWHELDSPAEFRLNPFTKEPDPDGPAAITLDENWAYFAGIFHGDGCASGNACAITHGSSGEYTNWRQTVRAACDAVGLPTSVSKDKRQTRLGSRVVRRYLEGMELCKEKGKSGAKHMRVPSWVMQGGPKIVWSYLAGLFDTDGTIGKKRAGTASVTTKYPEFAGQIAFLLRWLGMPVLVQPGWNKTYERYYYTIHVLGEGLERFLKYCPMRFHEKVEKLRERCDTIKRKCAPKDDEVLLVIDGGERTVYDFQVDSKDHLYLQGGLVGHNNLNFGLLYRMGAPKFCVYADLFDADGMPMVEYAREVIARWHAAYPKVAEFHERTELMLEANDWIAHTIFGRRRRLDEEARINRYRAVTQGIQFQVSGCVAPNTPVLTDRGYIEIAKLDGEPIFDGAGYTEDYSVHETGEKEVYEVKLADGRTLVCSKDHRLASMDGLEMSWPKVGELSEGDLVATHDVLAPQGDQDHGASTDEAYLIGALIGDGYYCDSRGFTIAASAKEPGWPESIEASVVASFGSWIKHRLRWGIRKTSRGGLVKDLVVHSSRARNSLMVLGLDGVSKLSKRIPEWVYTASPEIRGACLAGLIDTDGSVLSYKQGRYTSLTINYTSRVKELVEGAFRLASSLGIDSAIRELDVKSTSKKGGRTKQYRLDITYRGFGALNRWVPLRHPRKAATLEGALAVIAKRAPRRELPSSYVMAVASLAESAPLMASRHGSSVAAEDRRVRRKVQGYIGHARSGNAGENMVEAILDYIDKPGAKEPLMLGWSKVVSITPLGVQPTYDIEIHGENHAYIANGLLTHNSAQDIMKTAMIRIYEERNKRRANASPAERKLWERVKILLQIHDELVLEGPKQLKHEISDMFKRNMESVGKGHLRIPLAVDVKSGHSWDDIH